MGYAQNLFLPETVPVFTNLKRIGELFSTRHYSGELFWKTYTHLGQTFKLRKDPYCYCDWQTRTRIVDAEHQQEEKRLHKFLLGLDNSFRIIISQVLNMNPLPSVDNAYSMVIWEERQYVIVRDQDSQVEVVAFVARTTKKSIILCTICNWCLKSDYSK